MKLPNPIYLSFALALPVFVALATRNGWRLVEAAAAHTWRHLGPNTQHK